jgi:hypothetical protein
MRRTARILTAAAAALSTHLVPVVGLTTLSLGGTACFLMSKGPSNVAKGLRYQTGNGDYDEFFGTLYEVQLTLGQAPEREAEIRATLARKVKAAEGANADALGKAVTDRAGELSKDGIGIRLVVTGRDEEDETPSVDFEVSGPTPERSYKKVVNGIETAAKDGAALLGDMRDAKLKCLKLKDQAAALTGMVETAFKTEGPLKRSEVSKNLDDAQKLIPLMSDRASSVGDAAESLLEALEEAVGSSSPAPAPAAPAPAEADDVPEPAAPPGAAPPKQTPPQRAAPRPAPAPAPPPAAPAPKPPPPPADDFEP